MVKLSRPKTPNRQNFRTGVCAQAYKYRLRAKIHSQRLCCPSCNVDFWFLMSYSLVQLYTQCGIACCLVFRRQEIPLFFPEYGGSSFVLNLGSYVPKYAALQTRDRNLHVYFSERLKFHFPQNVKSNLYISALRAQCLLFVPPVLTSTFLHASQSVLLYGYNNTQRLFFSTALNMYLCNGVRFAYWTV